MAHSSPTVVQPNGLAKGFGAGYVFGVPMGNLGWFASLLMGLASGFAAFFAATFLGIVGIFVYNGAHGGVTGAGAVDFSLSYKWLGLPVGLVVMASALALLGTLWAKRMLRRA